MLSAHCSSALASNSLYKKNTKKQPYVSTNHGPPLTVLVCFVFWVLYSELDAKAEGQCANSIEEIDRFSRGFCDCCPACPKPNEKKQSHGGPWVVGPCLLSHISWISSSCACFVDFHMVWAPSIKSHLSSHKVASFCTAPLYKGLQYFFDMNPKSFSRRQLCKAPVKK